METAIESQEDGGDEKGGGAKERWGVRGGGKADESEEEWGEGEGRTRQM